MKLTLKEAIQSRKLKLIASELEALARKDRNVKKIVDQLKKGKEPSPSDITSLRGDTQDDVVMAFASVIGPSKTSDFLGESKEDSDIGDREGSQPAKYHSGLAKSTKEKRDAFRQALNTLIKENKGVFPPLRILRAKGFYSILDHERRFYNRNYKDIRKGPGALPTEQSEFELKESVQRILDSKKERGEKINKLGADLSQFLENFGIHIAEINN